MTTPPAAPWLAPDLGLPPDLVVDDPESLISALVLSETELDELRDPFMELCVDVRQRGIGRANTRLALALNSDQLLA